MRKIFTLVLIIAALCFLKPITTKAQVNVQDSLALVDLYNSTNGPHWWYRWGWLTTGPVSKWYGVTVTSNRVTGLYLYDNQLNGTIPSSMSNLTELESLDLEFNTLSGEMSTFYNLTKLSDLDLNGCGLTGNISFLSKLPNPQGIYLGGNHLTGKIPVMNCANLAVLELSYNQLSGSIPVFKKDTANLYGESGASIILEHNNLSGNISHKFDSIVHLNELVLNNNQLTGRISGSLNKFVGLTFLDLSNNQFTGKLPVLDSLKNLQYLFVDNNQLSGDLPASLNKNITLKEADFSNNNFRGKIPSLDSLNQFTILYLQNNQFTFAGMEDLVSHIYNPTYSPQANISIQQNGNVLKVSAGGTLANNTYKWYKNGVLFKTKTGNASLTINSNGSYSVAVTNSIATALTLYSDTINYAGLINSNTSQLNSENNFSSISVYPNPAKTIATILFNADGKYKITVTDISGKILQTKTGVASKEINSVQLDVSKYATGVYLISIYDEQGRRQTLKVNKE